jgi:hypothetical protein
MPRQAEPGVGPFFDLGGSDNLLGLMRIEGAGAGRPSLGQNLHDEQLGVDLGFERPGRANRAHRPVVGFHRFVRPKGHVPNIGLRHGPITPGRGESFAFDAGGGRHISQLWIG